MTTRAEAIEAAAGDAAEFLADHTSCADNQYPLRQLLAALALPPDPDVSARLAAALRDSLAWHARIGREGLTPDNREAWHAHMRRSRAALDLLPKETA